MENNPTDGAIALKTAIPEATYSLAGKKTMAQVMGTGEVTLKAKWSKDGKSLDLSIVHKETTSVEQGEMEIIKERWTLADGSDVLKVQRSVGTAGGSDAITLFFKKATSGASTPQH